MVETVTGRDLALDENERSLAERQLTLGQEAEDEGQRNWILARALLFKRALLSYQHGPPLGQGLEEAHRLVPHNTFLLEAVAFGTLGWFVPLALTALALWSGRKHRRFELGLALFGMLMMSHDILLLPSLIVPIALGMAGLRSAEGPHELPSETVAAAMSTTLLAIVTAFVASSVAAALQFSGDLNAQIDKRDIQKGPGHAFYSPVREHRLPGLTRVAATAQGTSEGFALLENEKPMTPSHDEALPVIELGQGRFWLWDHDTAIFASTDNSDPRANGKSYRLVTRTSPHPLLYLLAIAALIWALAATRALRTRF